ncbi:hypothetical protein GPJ56_009654 [Histomonas meleagridis]|uniref:uncharacterized protein n=1 Tax=Histomonas meleagridis TaxID=135588 RepID=UPI00355949BE|nr:hypothetical protein GPJ56_009654 [Histomonas meleagridis]KAH0804393.1 hypothetical protein GO595_003223 [Histomonas meleagridis]
MEERLDWPCNEKTNAEKAKAGKRYEGKHVLMNLNDGMILDCRVIEVSEKGFLVKPISISGLADDDSEMYDFDYNNPVPYEKFFHIFLAP